MRRLTSGGLAVVVGLLMTPVAAHRNETIMDVSYQSDPRLNRLRTFFEDRNCPLQEVASDFLAAADRHDLDWRLLPSISIVESSGGKYYRNNNIFGWDSCRQGFPTVRHGVHYVAERLATSDLYRDKDTHSKLRTYNPKLDYPSRVRIIMRALGPADLTAESSLN